MNYLEKGEALATGQILEYHVALQETTQKAYQALGEKTKAKAIIRSDKVSLPV